VRQKQTTRAEDLRTIESLKVRLHDMEMKETRTRLGLGTELAVLQKRHDALLQTLKERLSPEEVTALVKVLIAGCASGT
jgi:hypothetical protein